MFFFLLFSNVIPGILQFIKLPVEKKNHQQKKIPEKKNNQKTIIMLFYK